METLEKILSATENRSLTAIYEISKILSASLHLEVVLRDVVNVLSSYLEMHRAMVVLKNDDDSLRVVAASGATLETLRRGEVIPPERIAVRIFATGMPVVLSSIADSEDSSMEPGDIPGALEDEVVAGIGVPIRSADRTIGFLAIDRIWSSTRDVRIDTDVRFLTMVANLIGQTVRLHSSVVSDRQRLLHENYRLQKALAPQSRPSFDSIIGSSPRMQEVFAQIRQVAATRSTVLLRGESGTGKELVARALHTHSARRNKPFVKLNCAALSETLLESELFGHEKGAFTGATAERKGRFELAHGGTLFLDEIGEISASFQAKLLRVLQEGEFERVGGHKTLKVDVRLITATNRNLEKAVARGAFRADLYYRITVVPILLPPLRERDGDVLPLAQWFLDRFNAENGREVFLSDEAAHVLSACYFPGNVRELENCVYRTATLCKDLVIRDADFACQRERCLSATLWQHQQEENTDATPSVPSAPVPDDDDAALPHRDRLIQAMEKAGWVQAKAARLLNLTPRQMGYALRKHAIDIKRF